MNLLTLSILPALVTVPAAQRAADAPQPNWVDVDEDGLRDVYLTQPGVEDRLLVNAGDGTFLDITAEAGLGGQVGSRNAIWRDVNGDEQLDLLLVRGDGTLRLFHRTGGNFFIDGTREAGLEQVDGAIDAEWMDYDQDGSLDLMITTQQAVHFLHREIDGSFRELAPMAGSRGAVAIQPQGTWVAAPDGPNRSSLGGWASGRSAGTSDLQNTVVPTQGNPTATTVPFPNCASSIIDQATGDCGLQASSVPTLGMLYPLSGDLFIDATSSYVGISNTDPQTPLDVTGTIRSRAGGFAFPDGTVQTSAVSGGGVPSGYQILGRTPIAPSGYSYSGLHLETPGATDWASGAASKRADASADALDGAIHIIGGTSSTGTVLDEHFEYDPSTDTWLPLADMLAPRTGVAAVALDGYLYAVGGLGAFGGINRRLDRYDPSTDSWTQMANMNLERYGHAASALDGKIYVVGGRTGTTTSTDEAEVYDPTTNTWSAIAPLPESVWGVRSAVVGGKLYVVGGVPLPLGGGNVSNSLYEYDVDLDQWVAKATMPVRRAYHVAASVNGMLQVIGGRDNSQSTVSSAWSYDPVTDSWSQGVFLPDEREFAAGAVLSDAVIHVIGGYNDAGVVANTNYYFTHTLQHYLHTKD